MATGITLRESRDSRDSLTGPGRLVYFYEDPTELILTAGRFLKEGLKADRVAIVIATEANRRVIESQLAKHGIELETAKEQRLFFSYDARETLEEFMDGDLPSESKFMRFFSELLERSNARLNQTHIRVFSEMISLLWKDSKFDAAIAVESFWNSLANDSSFSIVCASPLVGGTAGREHYLKFSGVQYPSSAAA